MQERHWSWVPEWMNSLRNMHANYLKSRSEIECGFQSLDHAKSFLPISVSLSFWLAGQREYWRGLWPSSLTAVGMSPFIWKVCPFKSCHSVLRCATNTLHFLRCLSLLVERFIYVPLCVPAATDKQHKLPCHYQACPVFQLRKRREVEEEKSWQEKKIWTRKVN